MDLRYDVEDEAYREHLRAWLAEHLPEGPLPGDLDSAVRAARDWQRALFGAGYLGLAWPQRYGGQEATLTRQVIVAEELARASAPPVVNMIGLSILGPTLIQHGTEHQRERFLRRILTAEDLWCQGFSEPEAGSDLASLRTRAVLDGNVFVVNGQKLWTSLGPIADWIFLLARTDPEAPKHEGISFLLCSMDTPGLDVRPLRNAAGGRHFSEIFLEDVRIPADQLVGDLHASWRVARSTLDNERSGLSGVVDLERTLGRIWRLASGVARGPARALDDPMLRRELAQRWIEVEGLRYLGYRALSAQLAGRDPGAESAVGKLFASELRRRLATSALHVEGPLAQLVRGSPQVLDRGRWPVRYFDALGHSIGGGTSEIMRNVIAERVLGLPRSAEEPS